MTAPLAALLQAHPLLVFFAEKRNARMDWDTMQLRQPAMAGTEEDPASDVGKDGEIPAPGEMTNFAP